ncbi:MAG: ATP-dependent Clp protease proteolytic subunit [Negativicutes bacterium]|nr:ATP-dependent Clp protease proteolytic subunit [Negativicutes bacterium]
MEIRNDLVPIVIEQSSRGERSYDIFSRMLRDRIVFLNGEVNMYSVNLVIAQLLFLEAEDPEKEINLYINSPGGEVYSGLALYDTMQYLKAPVNTICVGLAASMAAVILSAGKKRMALPHSRILIHQPLGGAQGQAADIKIQAEEILRIRQTLNEILAKHTKQDIKEIENRTDRDNYFTAPEALEFGLIDQIFENKNK